MPLDAEDLAYMRETQAEHRPTAATHQRRAETPDGMGGTDTSDGEPEPVQVRISPADLTRTQSLADQYGAGIVDVTMDLVTVQAGDTITVSPTEVYEVVSDGAIGEWTTAQNVLAVRTTWPPVEA